MSNNLNPNSTFFTSDVHIFHRNIIKYSNRPFNSVEEMNAQLIKNWNNVVQPNDAVFSLGDFAFAKIGHIIEVLQQLNGEITMITGNHDEEILNNRKLLLDMGLVKQIVPYKEIRVGNQFICLFHYGCRVWNKSHHGSWLLYGHSHGTLPPFGKSVDVGVDAPFVTGKPEYRPLSFYEIKDFMDKQNQESVDHH
jgi:calcineurin-like phosphoesterase family protein